MSDAMPDRVTELLSQHTTQDKLNEKLTERARQALLLADEEANLLNHNYIGTEHILLGLIREEAGIASSVLKGLGIELLLVRNFVEQLVGRGPEPSHAARTMTPRVHVVLGLAANEAWRSSYVGTEHLLLGLVREGEGIAAGAIETLCVTLEQVRRRVYQAMLSRGLSVESLKSVVKSKNNVVTCRIDDEDLEAIDALVEVGVRSTRSDAASWLIHAGIEANQIVLESVYTTVSDIRHLRTKAQALVQQATKSEEKSAKPSSTGEDQNQVPSV